MALRASWKIILDLESRMRYELGDFTLLECLVEALWPTLDKMNWDYLNGGHGTRCVVSRLPQVHVRL